MLMDVYMGDELDKIDNWIENIIPGNEVMEKFHVDIHKVKDKTQEQILEAKKYYNDACLNIFEDESRDKLLSVQIVVKQF